MRCDAGLDRRYAPQGIGDNDDLVDSPVHGIDFLECLQRNVNSGSIEITDAGTENAFDTNYGGGDRTVTSLSQQGQLVSESNAQILGQQASDQGLICTTNV